MKQRRNEKLVAAEQFADEPPHASTPARFARAVHSSRSAEVPAETDRGLAMTTIHVPSSSKGRARRTISRIRRRTLLRSTAPPTFFEVMNPMRAGLVSTFFKTPSSISFPCTATPSVRTRTNSDARFSRAFPGKRRRGGRFVESSAASWRKFDSGWEGLRPACDVRNAPRRLSAGGASVRAGGGARASRDRSSSSCGRENRTVVCGCAWNLDMCV